MRDDRHGPPTLDDNVEQSLLYHIDQRHRKKKLEKVTKPVSRCRNMAFSFKWVLAQNVALGRDLAKPSTLASWVLRATLPAT